MERLTTRNRNGTIGIGEPLRPYNYEDIKGILSRLADIEDILGDDYDLDRLDVMVNQCMTMREEVAERFSTTCNIPVARLRELVEADREGRVRIHARPNDHTCGSCVHFRRITGRCCGTCTIQSRYRDKYGREDDRRGTFTPSQSRKACRWYEKNVGEET